jgi:hypothetical protein
MECLDRKLFRSDSCRIAPRLRKQRLSNRTDRRLAQGRGRRGLGAGSQQPADMIDIKVPVRTLGCMSGVHRLSCSPGILFQARVHVLDALPGVFRIEQGPGRQLKPKFHHKEVRDEVSRTIPQGGIATSTTIVMVERNVDEFMQHHGRDESFAGIGSNFQVAQFNGEVGVEQDHLAIRRRRRDISVIDHHNIDPQEFRADQGKMPLEPDLVRGEQLLRFMESIGSWGVQHVMTRAISRSHPA